MKVLSSSPVRFAAVAIVDVIAATIAAVGLWLCFGVSTVLESNPPICSTYFGRHVDCALETPWRIAEVAVFVAALAGLVGVQLLGRRHRNE